MILRWHGPLHHHARFYVNVFLSRFPGSRTILAHLSLYVYRVCTFLFFIYRERDPCHRKVFCAFFPSFNVISPRIESRLDRYFHVHSAHSICWVLCLYLSLSRLSSRLCVLLIDAAAYLATSSPSGCSSSECIWCFSDDASICSTSSQHTHVIIKIYIFIFFLVANSIWWDLTRFASHTQTRLVSIQARIEREKKCFAVDICEQISRQQQNCTVRPFFLSI